MQPFYPIGVSGRNRVRTDRFHSMVCGRVCGQKVASALDKLYDLEIF